MKIGLRVYSEMKLGDDPLSDVFDADVGWYVI